MSRTYRILVAGDHFVRNDILTAALPGAPRFTADVRELTLPWPLVPFGPVGDVEEASDVEDELIQAIGGVEVVVTQMAPITTRVLDAAPNLRLIVCTRGGPVNVNVAAASERGVTVCNTPGRNAVAAAEHAVALIMATIRAVPRTHAATARGEWRSDLYAYDECGLELAGSTVGLIGYGAIGRRVAQVLQAFGATVVVYDPFVSADTVESAVEVVPLTELLGRSDVVTLHARLTPETAAMIDKDAIAAMRPGAFLINTARGGLVDYDAVAAALASGHLGGAGFDVFPTEPPSPDWPLLDSDRVVLTPHLAGATRQTAHRAADMAAAAVSAYLDGLTPPHVVA